MALHVPLAAQHACGAKRCKLGRSPAGTITCKGASSYMGTMAVPAAGRVLHGGHGPLAGAAGRWVRAWLA